MVMIVLEEHFGSVYMDHQMMEGSRSRPNRLCWQFRLHSSI